MFDDFLGFENSRITAGLCDGVGFRGGGVARVEVHVGVSHALNVDVVHEGLVDFLRHFEGFLAAHLCAEHTVEVGFP